MNDYGNPPNFPNLHGAVTDTVARNKKKRIFFQWEKMEKNDVPPLEIPEFTQVEKWLTYFPTNAIVIFTNFLFFFKLIK